MSHDRCQNDTDIQDESTFLQIVIDWLCKSKFQDDTGHNDTVEKSDLFS